MSSFLSSLSSSLGLGSKSSSSSSKGHRLGGGGGGGSNNNNNNNNNHTSSNNGGGGGSIAEGVYEIIFVEEKLGLKIDRDINDRPVVTGLVAGKAAEALGCQVNDVIIAIDGNTISSHSDFIAVVEALGRPVAFRFYRQAGNSYDPYTGPHSASNPNPLGVSGGVGLSTSEIESRRDAMIRAAQDRAGAWDRKVKGGSSKNKQGADGKPKSRYSDDDLLPSQPAISNSETAEVVRFVKRKEQQTASAMGYDPFKPLMSFNMPGGVTSTSSSGGSAEIATAPSAVSGKKIIVNGILRTGSESPHSPNPTSNSKENSVDIEDIVDVCEIAGIVDAYPDVADKVNAALEILLTSASSSSPSSLGDTDRITTALATMLKMLSNLIANPGEAKFASIRLANAAFQARVASVPGAIELFLAAGFFLDHNPQNLLEQPEFLKHANSAAAIAHCKYTALRIAEILR